MYKKFTLTVISLLCIAGISMAQSRCATDEVYQRALKEHPEIAQIEDELNAQIEGKLQNGSLKLAHNKTTSAGDTTTYDITLVIHIVHDYGNEDLSDNDILTAVDYWNQVYTCQLADTADVIAPFKPYVGDARIRLHLATLDPNGNPTKGITHRQSYLTFTADDQAKYDQWPPNEYVNIWFINTFGAEETGAAAYAYLPASAQFNPYYDGVIGLYSYANYDKAIPHELGHVLNLQHPWGNTNNPDVACGDDNVWDTPPTKGHNPTGCTAASLYDVTCATGYTHTYDFAGSSTDSVTVDYPDTTNAQNIMDYTYCQKMFTKGQVYRMRTSLLASTANRNNLSLAPTLALTGALDPYPDLPPVADFSIEKGVGGGVITERCFFLCSNSITDFKFVNKSWNDTISSVAWSLSNGATTPTSASQTFITSQFLQPGWATVTLTANSNAGTSTITKDVYVADTVATPAGGYVQNFSDSVSLDKWPMFNYYNNQFQWEYYTGAGYDDNACVRFRSYDNRTSPANKTGTPAGDHDDMFTPGFDLSGSTGTLNLNFYTAGAYRSGNFNSSNVDDTLEVWVSISCGTRWVKIATLGSGAILNNPSQGTEFVPTSAQWKSQTINVPSAYWTNKTFFKFRYRSGIHGNNMYLDKVSLSPFPADVEAVYNHPNTFVVFPNPSNNGCTLAFKTGIDGKISYNVKDIAGKTIYSKEEVKNTGENVQLSLPRTAVPAAGMYFITLTNGGQTTTQKFVVY